MWHLQSKSLAECDFCRVWLRQRETGECLFKSETSGECGFGTVRMKNVSYGVWLLESEV